VEAPLRHCLCELRDRHRRILALMQVGHVRSERIRVYGPPSILWRGMRRNTVIEKNWYKGGHS
jgi:hypothetical protein